MHAAPSVSYPVGRSRFAGALLAGAWLLAAAAILAFGLASTAPGWRQALAGAALAGSGVAALAGWLRSPAGTLAWDGGGWRWEQDDPAAHGEAGRPELALDLQARMLLRWVPAQGSARWRTRWLWVERNAAVSHWDALRRAVYSRANTTGASHGGPPAA
jgi:toxin CptA